MLGFTVRTESPLFEVGIATDPALFRPENRSGRSRRNFYSSRSIGAIRARRGEAVYLVPPDVLANFVGQSRLYFGLATYRENSGGVPDSVQAPTEGHMYVNLSGLTERGLRRLAGRPTSNGAYGATNGHDPSLDWGGDAQLQAQPPAQLAPNGNGKAAVAAPAPTAAPAPIAPYDDGFGEFPAPQPAPAPTATPGTPVTTAPTTTPQALARRTRALEAEDDAYGIEGPIPDDEATAQAQALRSRAMEAPAPDFPGASRFVPAHPSNYRTVTAPREVDQIVIHITDGGSRITGTIGWFQNPNQRNARGQPIHVSAHYVVGRDGEVVQMVRDNDVAWHASSANGHSIGIEHVANTRGLLPTEEEYRGSAALVSWLCGQYGLPLDRSHVLGHAEADPHTSHTDCPNAVWDWDHYMDCLREAAGAASSAPAPTAQGLGRAAPRPPQRARARTAYAHAQEVVTPFYDPADPSSALTCQNDAFSLAREEWFVGVPNATIFPHSAICKLEMTAPDGSLWGGTGFYIGNKRILTCAHNLHGKTQVVITPGSNAAGDAPFGSSTVQSSSWRVAPGYSGSGDWAKDLAVIDNVPLAAPNGQWFRFLNATPSDRLPIVVCGYSAQSDAVPALTDAIDGEKQHLHGGYAAEQSTPEVIEYPILTLHGASGSPVYHVDDSGSAPQALVCAVHVTGEPAAQGLNRGCFITPTKIDWIEGRARSFALAAVAGRVRRQASARAQGLTDVLPVDLKLRVFIPAPVAIVTVPGIGGAMPGQSAHGGDGRGFQLDGGTSRAEVTARFHFSGDTGHPTLTDITRRFGESANYDISDTVVAPGKPEWYRTLRPGAQPTERGTQSVTDDKLRVALGGSANDGIASMAENAVVATFDLHASDPIVTGAPDIDATLAVLLKVDGDRIKARVRGGHDEFPAYELYANGVRVYAYDPVAEGGTPWGLFGDGVWDVNPEGDYVDVGPKSEYRIIGPVRIGGTAAQSLSFQAFSQHWDDTPYQPQSSESSCWAAAAAMVVGWRDQVCIADSEIAAHVPVIDAYRNGLAPSARRVLGEAWNLVAEPPASYTIEAFRQMLADCGPLYVGMNWDKQGGGHARVLVGMESGGADDGSDTTMFLYDPWPDTPGRIRMPFNEFVQLYEGRMTESGGIVDVQILHPDSAQGRSPATAAPFALSLSAAQVRAPAERNAARRTALPPSSAPRHRGARALGTEPIEYPVQLVPQPNKLACWAASMAMLLSFRRNASYEPETLAAEVGGSLMASYGWELLDAVRDRYGFTAIEMPSDASLYFSAAQWAQWLRDCGPLWVVIVGMPHAVVISGLRGNTEDANACEVRLLNPWDTRVAFDDDQVEFHPANAGYADWLPFQQFASDFGNMAEPDYGNWRVLHLPAQPAASAPAPAMAPTAQGLSASRGARHGGSSRGGYLVTPPRPVRALSLEDAPPPDEPIEPSRVAGTTMRRQRGNRGRVTWALDQLDGVKLPDPAAAMVPALGPTTITLDQWPRVGRDAVPLPLTVRFGAGGGAVGNVRISAGTTAELPYDVTVTATIEDDAQNVPGMSSPQAAVRVTIDYDFSGMPDGEASARVRLRLVGNGRYDLDSAWQGLPGSDHD